MGKILLAALVLRLINLNQSLWLDEAISFVAVRSNSLQEIITRFIPGDVHPPLYYLVLKAWTDIFGYSEISLRMPSVLAGVLAVFVVYKIGGKWPALFLAINPLAIYYSQEARMYSLAMLFVAAAAYFFLKGQKIWFLFFFLLTLYTDYLPWLMFPVFLPYSLWSLIFLLPWLPTMVKQLIASQALAQGYPLWGQVVGGFTLKALVLAPVKFIFGRIPSHPVMIFPIAIYFWLLTRARKRFYWLWLLAPIVLGAIISIKVPIFTYHRFLFVVPAFVLLLGANIKRWSAAFIIFVSLASLITFIFNPNLHRENWRAATAYINSDPGKVMLPNFSQAPALTYYGAKMDEKNNPVYLIRYVQEIFDPGDSLRLNLEKSGYKNIEQKNFNGVVVWKYAL